MKHTPSWLTAVLFLGCMALGYIVVHQNVEITQATKEILQEKNETAQADLHPEMGGKATQKQIQSLQQQLAAAQALIKKQQAAWSASDPDGNMNGVVDLAHLGDIVKDHPEYAALYAKLTRRSIERMYGVTLSSLNLPSKQLSQLVDLLAERQMSSRDALQVTKAAGLAQGSPDWQNAMTQATQDVDQQIAAILGNNGGPTLTQLQVRAGAQYQTDNTFAPDFMYAGVPLSSQQSSGLVQAIAGASYAGKDLSTRPAGYNTIDPTTGLTPHDNAILTSAARVLSPPQVQILKNDQIERHQYNAIVNQFKSAPTKTMP
jgi:hypothetical protein